MIIITSSIPPLSYVSYEPDLKPYLRKERDIIRFNKVVVNGSIAKTSILTIKINIQTSFDQMCAVTGYAVLVELDFDVELTFGNDEKYDYPFQNTIDLDELVFAYIVSEKPCVVYHSSVNTEDI